MLRRCLRLVFSLAATSAVFMLPQAARAGFSLGAGSNYAVLYEGTGPAGNNEFQFNTFTINGNVGIGGTGAFHSSGGGTFLNGNVDFSAPNTGQYNPNGLATSPVVSYNVAAVTSGLNTVNALSTNLAAEGGAGLAITNGTVINAMAGTLDATGNRVFNVTSFSSNSGDTITINGDAAGDSVVLNFAGNSDVHFDSMVVLTGGLTPDKVLYNISGTGKTLQIVANNQSSGAVEGVFLAPNDTIQVNNSKVVGRIFGGDSTNMQIVSGGSLTAPPAPPVPEPRSLLITLGLSVAIVFVASRRKSVVS